MTDKMIDYVFLRINTASENWNKALQENISYKGFDIEEEKRLFEKSEEAWKKYLAEVEYARSIGIIS